MNTKIIIAVSLLIIFNIMQFIIFYKMYGGHKRIVEDKNLRLIQLYLDTKFISKIIFDSIHLLNPKVFCEALALDIISYYNLEDIIITGPLLRTTHTRNNFLGNNVAEFIKEHSEQIEDLIARGNFVKVNFETDTRKLQLYISPIKKTISQGLIICVENAPVLLNDYEQSSMENCINLMKTRLVQLS